MIFCAAVMQTHFRKHVNNTILGGRIHPTRDTGGRFVAASEVNAKSLVPRADG